MKSQLINTLILKSKECYKEYCEAQLSIKKTHNDQIKRQAKLYEKNLTEEQMNEIINEPQKLNELLMKKMNKGKHNVLLDNFISDIQDKNRDIQNLEKVQINSIFFDKLFYEQECVSSLSTFYRFGDTYEMSRRYD